MMHHIEPINPVTLRGKWREARNLSIGRMWLGTDSSSDGANRFNPTNLQGTWEKLMQFIIWEETQTLMGFMVINDEDVFITKIQELFAFKKPVTLLGGAFRGDEKSRLLTFGLPDAEHLYVKMKKADSDDPLLASLLIPIATFRQGMQHLFVRGELKL